MRARHSIAIAAAILVGFGLKLFFFSAPIAKADVKMAGMDISAMHKNIKVDLPVANYNDMTFVFSDFD